MKRSSIIVAIFYVSLILSCFFSHSHEHEEEQNINEGGGIKGMFVFGSSLVDNGNNNFLDKSKAKADYLPYGIDFPLGPSGRFTNGKNAIDLLGDFLKLPSLIPPFADPSTKGDKIVHGVNYASGASGILDDTGSLAGNVMSLKKQIKNFEKVTLPELKGKSMSDYLFVVGSGGNDYSFNYFLKRPNITLQAFTLNLTASLSLHLKKLYSLGGRKFVLISVNPLGCTPMVRISTGMKPIQKECMQKMNKAVHLFNSKLKVLVDVLKPEMESSNLVYLNSYKIIRDIIRNPSSKGFKDVARPCCEVSSIKEGGNGILCKRGGTTCTNRSSYVFFDGLHPTEAVNVHIATKAFGSKIPTEVYPMNIHQLVTAVD